MNLEFLKDVNERNIEMAGPRYSPGIDSNAPNIEIESLLDEIDALSLSEDYRESVAVHAKNIKSSWSKSSEKTKSLFSKYNPIAISVLINELSKQGGESCGRISSALKKNVYILTKKLNTRLEDLERNIRDVEDATDEHRSIKSEISELKDMKKTLTDVLVFLNSRKSDLLVNNKLVILGQWGTGKTHFLCDVTRKRVSKKMPTLFLLANQLSCKGDFFDVICEAVNIKKGQFDSFLKKMNGLGEVSKTRSLIIIDGINESDRLFWKKNFKNLIDKINCYPHVGLIISCRIPFENQVFTAKARKDFVETHHNGFYDVEFDSQKSFFKYYDIPTPHVPLLTPEFTRPLFLKILCLTLSGKTKTTKSRWLDGIQSGQRGMTKIFEDFVNYIGSDIEKDFSLPSETCWKIFKGKKLLNGKNSGIAVSMTERVRDYLYPRECMSVIESVSHLKKADVKSIFDRFIFDGLLVEDVIWQEDKSVKVIRFPYQRFSDHLIARHLIDNYLDVRSENRIRRSFYANNPLGKVFELTRWEVGYKMPGLASAIMIEFPERVKRVLPVDSRELVFYLPKERRSSSALSEVFLESLLWRDKNSFSIQTGQVVKSFLESDNKSLVNKTFEALIILACRPGHPFSSERLKGYLEKKCIYERDLSWSEYVRGAHEESVIFRLMNWIEDGSYNNVDYEFMKGISLLLSLFLTTTNRGIRDRATKNLVLIGDRNPKAVFDIAVQMFSFNDPYVSERLLASCYGVAMHNWSFPSEEMRMQLSRLSRKIYDGFFCENALHKTSHILTRDYALGIIELSRKINRSCLGGRSLKNLKNSLKNLSSIPELNQIDESFCNIADNALMMDFKNYTIGRLVSDRNNYDFEHDEYKKVLKQIKWRIVDLGYNSDRFSSIDRLIGQQSFYSEQKDGVSKIDRYGKKYSWIAFFEVAGIRLSEGTLPERHMDRISDCDIDPSFPEKLRIWKPPLSKYFTNKFTNPRAWVISEKVPDYDNLLKLKKVDEVEGDWILLDGFIREFAPNDPRRIFTFLRGVLVDSSNIPKLRMKFNAQEYPGNDSIPNSPQEYYIFSGEVPWSKKYGASFNSAKKAKRYVEGCCETRKNVKKYKKFSDLNKIERLRFSMEHEPMDSILKSLKINDEEKKEGGMIDKSGHVEVSEFVTIPGIPVEIPICQLMWESHHSSENQNGGVDYLAPAICDFLNLKNKGRSQDLFDVNNKQATMFRVFGEDDDFEKSSMLYIRRDLLKNYLNSTGQKLVWLIWGEKDFDYKSIEKMRPEIEDVWESHGHIFKKMKVARI